MKGTVTFEMTLHSQRKVNSSTWKKLRLRILNRDGRECYWCGMEANTVDHIIPVAKGGTDDPENLVAACRKCNFSKQDKMPDEFVMQRAGLFSNKDSTAMSYRGFLSPPNESKRH
jgi:5-methylcytosine-specific restriction endonuclease McrA